MLGRNRRADGTASACGRPRRAVRLQTLATKSLVAFLAFLLAFGTTPAQLWAEGAEGLAKAAQDALTEEASKEGAGESSASSDAGQTADEVQHRTESKADWSSDSEESASDQSQAPSISAGSNTEKGSTPAAKKGKRSSQAASSKRARVQKPARARSDGAAASARAKEQVAISFVSVKSEDGSTNVGSRLVTGIMTGATPNSPGKTIVAEDYDISYQWQYAEESSTADADFTDIPGATASSYVIPTSIDGKSAAGLYLRVVAKSKNEVPSTKAWRPVPPTFEYPVDPFGPVTAEGQLALGSVALASTKKVGSNSFFQVGATVTPSAKLSTGGAVPSDAKLTYTWYQADSEKGAGKKLPADSYNASNGKIKLDGAWEGTYLYVTVSAGANTVQSERWQVMAKDTYQLVATNLNPYSGTLTSLSSNVKVFWVTAKALERGDAQIINSSITSTKGLSFSWCVSDSKTGPWTELEGETNPSLKPIPAQAGGKYLKVVVTSGDSHTEKVFPSKIVDGNSLSRVADQLKTQTFKPTYGTDTNFNDVVKAKLKQLGYDDVDVRVKSATKITSKDYVTVGISARDDATNGDITFASYDPDKGFSSSDDWKLKVSLELSRDGERVDCALTRDVSIPLDTDTMTSYLEKAAQDFSFTFAEGDTADSVTQGFEIPRSMVDGKSWIVADWKIDPADVITLPNVYYGEPCTVTPRATDTKVALTATFRMSSNRDITTERTFAITVKGDPSAKPQEVTASVSVIGMDAMGAEQAWMGARDQTVAEGSTVADLSVAAFKAAGLTYEAIGEGSSWMLSTITSPSDPDRKLGWDQATGRYWQLFVNGKAAQAGAGGMKVAAGDKVVWRYAADDAPEPSEKFSVTASIVGRDAAGNEQMWAAPTTIQVEKGATAADVTMELCKQASVGLSYDPDSTFGWFLKSMTSPYDPSVTLLSWDQQTGESWQLFYDGKYSQLGAGNFEVESGKTIVWYYGKGQTLPGTDAPIIDPTAPRPDYEASWGGFAHGQNGAVVENILTPSETAQVKWTYDYRGENPWASASDSLIVNGDIYFLSNGELVKIDGETGKEKARVSVGGSNRYFCRPAYSDGLIIVPLDDGSLAGITADTLTCVWKTAALKKPVIDGKENSYQALSSLTVANGCVYAGFTVPGGVNAGRAGALVCVRISDGSVLWTRASTSEDSNHAEGYYWAGAVASGRDIIIGDESGAVSLIDGATGKVKSTVSVRTPVRATMVSAGTEGVRRVYLAVSRDDGTLYKVYRDGDALTLGKGVAFAAESTSTPAVSGGRAYVCGVDAEGYGTLSVIDLASMKVVRTVRADKGKSQSSPLVSVVNGATYVYFTCNAYPGGVYVYRDGDTEAHRLFTPDADKQQYCTASIITDEHGNLYYTNDSGTLFALAATEGWRVSFDTQGGSEQRDIMVPKGQALNAPVDPERAGYVFRGWYLDAAGTRAWDFSQPVSGDMTLFAVWRKVAGDGTHADGGVNGGNGSKGDGLKNDGAASTGAARSPMAPLGGAVGFIAPGKSPIAKASLSAATAAQTDAVAHVSGKGGADDTADAVALSASGAEGSRAARAEGGRFPAALALGAAGAAGVVGLIAAGLWLAALKRRG